MNIVLKHDLIEVYEDHDTSINIYLHHFWYCYITFHVYVAHNVFDQIPVSGSLVVLNFSFL